MNSRRSHKKSRLGCANCKRRRVKCDEGGPPCGPCASRSMLGCEYTGKQPRMQPTPPEERDDSLSTADAKEDQSPSQRLLELELIHQWSTVTYKSYCGTIEEEYHNWQVTIPRLAFKHECLLHALFAMSALEIAELAEAGSADEYIDIALRYQNVTASELREKLSVTDLSTCSQEDHRALWAVSSILMVLALALPRYCLQETEKYSMLDHMLTYLEFLKGLVVVVWSGLKALEDEPLLSKYATWEQLKSKPLTAPAQSAIDRLVQLNEENYGATSVKRRVPEVEAITLHAACRTAIFYLEGCYAKCSESDTRAYALAWLLQAGADFVSAIKAREPLALLILCHWGAHVETSAYGIWWAKRVGYHLVHEISTAVAQDVPMDNELMMEGLKWVREQVGLES